MNLRWLVCGCCALALNALAACGGDDGGDEDEGGGGAALPGSLERDTPLADLGPEDLGDLCAALAAELSASISDDDTKRLTCTLFALLTSAQAGANGQATVDRAACEQAVQDCLDSDLGEPMSETMCEPTRVQTAAEGCTVTVGEYFDCLNGGVQQLQESLDGFTCEALSRGDAAASLGSDPSDLGSVPECMTIETECPALLDGGGSAEPPSASGCDDTCRDANDDFCDDGGEGSQTSFCGLGTDCGDCGPR